MELASPQRHVNEGPALSRSEPRKPYRTHSISVDSCFAKNDIHVRTPLSVIIFFCCRQSSFATALRTVYSINMAEPEVQLPPAPDNELNHSHNPDMQLDESEKHPIRESTFSSLARLSSQDEVVYHYLTFETNLPSPAYLSQPDYSHSHQSPPLAQCPNLDKYTSPFLWSAQRKTIITYLSCAATAVTAYAAGSYSSGSA